MQSSRDISDTRHHFATLPAQAQDIRSAKTELATIAMLGQGEGWDMPVGVFRSAAAFDAAFEAHPHVTLSIVASGDPVERLDGAFRGRKAHARSAEVMVYAGGSARRWAYRKGTVVCQAYLTSSYLDAVAHSEGIDAQRIRLRDDRVIAEDRVLRHGLETYLDRVRSPFAAANSLEIDAHALLIGLHLVRRYATNPPARSTGARRTTLRAVIEHIECNLDQRLSVLALAQIAHLSPRALFTAFRRETGMAPHQFVLHRRIERAKTLLLAGEPIARIAAHTGFSSQQHFSNAFHATVGVARSSPKALPLRRLRKVRSSVHRSVSARSFAGPVSIGPLESTK